MKMDDDLLMWVDLETTGVDPEADSIIEIAAIWTTPDLAEADRWQATVAPSDGGFSRLLADSTVLAMHVTNGLYRDVTEKPDYADAWEAGEALRDAMCKANKSSGRDPWARMTLAGSGVGHFDRRFIEHHMPDVYAILNYWHVDIGVVRRAWRMWTGETAPTIPQTDKTHRAMDDIESHLDEARRFRRFWLTMLDPPF